MSNILQQIQCISHWYVCNLIHPVLDFQGLRIRTAQLDINDLSVPLPPAEVVVASDVGSPGYESTAAIIMNHPNSFISRLLWIMFELPAAPEASNIVDGVRGHYGHCGHMSGFLRKGNCRGNGASRCGSLSTRLCQGLRSRGNL